MIERVFWAGPRLVLSMADRLKCGLNKLRQVFTRPAYRYGCL
jgi:hypothetical protein